MKRAVLVALVALFVAGLRLPDASAAPQPTCGGSIAASVKLTKNILSCASDPALVFTGNDITLDLNGHTLSGTGFGDGIAATGKNHVTVKNGTIKNFTIPVFFLNGSDETAQGLTLFGGATDVVLNATSRALVARSRMSVGGTSCVSVLGAADTVVRSNRMSCNARGVNVDSSALSTLVTGNRITGGTVGVDVFASGFAFTRVIHNVITGAGTGIDLAASADGANVLDNTVTKNTNNGIHVASGADAIAIGGNIANGNQNDGIQIQSSASGIEVGTNTANNNGILGIEATVNTDDAGGNRARGNGNVFECTFVVCR